MADVNHPREDDDSLPPGMGATPFGQEPEVDDDAPRRAASARFIVDSTPGAEAAMRDAMDPANQSLADALRLSFRVLQAVILVLVVLFLASGFQTVDDGESGVKTVWGKIVPEDGSEALHPGLKFSFFPYPIGEFILFQAENRTVELTDAFAPRIRGNLTHEQMLEQADLRSPLAPGIDGSLLTRDGDLAHLKLSARYAIDQAGDFVRRINDDDKTRDADRLVRLALQRAAIHVVAGASLQEMIDQTEDIRGRIQNNAQQVLDGLRCGIQLTHVQVQDAYAPLGIKKALGDLQEARVAAAASIERARQRANETLNRVAGKDYTELNALIEQYEDSLERNNETEAASLLAAINAKLDENDGDVSQIIQSAKAFQSQIESTLGNEYRRFSSLLPAYRSNPMLMVREQWLRMYAKLISQPDAEVLYVPDPLMSITIGIAGSTTIQEIRRKAVIARKERETNMKAMDGRSYIERASDMSIGKAGRQLKIENGKAVPLGVPR